MKLSPAVAFTAENTELSPMPFFWRKAQFPQSFGWFPRSFVETVLFHKISIPGNLVILRSFAQCLNDRQLVFFGKEASLLFPFSKKRNVPLGPGNCFCYKEMSDWNFLRNRGFFILNKRFHCSLVSELTSSASVNVTSSFNQFWKMLQVNGLEW